MRLDMDYASRATLWSDIKMLLSTFGEVALPHASKNKEALARPRWSWLAPSARTIAASAGRQ